MILSPIAQIDLDGTLAAYDEAMRRDMRLLQAPGETPWVRTTGKDPEYVKERIRLIRNQPGWWERLDKYPPGFEILSELQALEFKCCVLTKGPIDRTPDSFLTSAAWTEKVRWCQKHVPHLAVTITEDKGMVYGKVLVDDWPPYAEAWLAWRPRGLVIMPAHPWNEEFSHPNAIRYTGDNILEVRARLAALCASLKE